MDTRRLLATLGAGTLLTAGVAGASLVGATQQGDTARHVAVVQQDQLEDEREGTDEAITGDALDRASEAALEYIGEGRVTDTEVGDEEGYYEIEVTRDDGGQVDVHLDENFEVLGNEVDGREDD